MTTREQLLDQLYDLQELVHEKKALQGNILRAEKKVEEANALASSSHFVKLPTNNYHERERELEHQAYRKEKNINLLWRLMMIGICAIALLSLFLIVPEPGGDQAGMILLTISALGLRAFLKRKKVFWSCLFLFWVIYVNVMLTKNYGIKLPIIGISQLILVAIGFIVQITVNKKYSLERYMAKHEQELRELKELDERNSKENRKREREARDTAHANASRKREPYIREINNSQSRIEKLNKEIAALGLVSLEDAEYVDEIIERIRTYRSDSIKEALLWLDDKKRRDAEAAKREAQRQYEEFVRKQREQRECEEILERISGHLDKLGKPNQQELERYRAERDRQEALDTLKEISKKLDD